MTVDNTITDVGTMPKPGHRSGYRVLRSTLSNEKKKTTEATIPSILQTRIDFEMCRERNENPSAAAINSGGIVLNSQALSLERTITLEIVETAATRRMERLKIDATKREESWGPSRVS